MNKKDLHYKSYSYFTFYSQLVDKVFTHSLFTLQPKYFFIFEKSHKVSNHKKYEALSFCIYIFTIYLLPIKKRKTYTMTTPSGSPLDSITNKERQKIQNAFSDPEFRKLFSDYMTEISDPKHREEQDLYIRQLEEKSKKEKRCNKGSSSVGDSKEEESLPEGKIFVRPQPIFVVKFWYSEKDKEEKMFVNIVVSDKIDLPSSSNATATSRNNSDSKKNQTLWSFPYSIGPLRMEQSGKAPNNNSVITFDCCFHPKTVQLALLSHQHGANNHSVKNNSGAFLELLIQSAREGVEQQFRQALKKKISIIQDRFRILKGVTYKNGKPPVMMIPDPNYKKKNESTPSNNNKKKDSKVVGDSCNINSPSLPSTGDTTTRNSTLFTKGFLQPVSSIKKKKNIDGIDSKATTSKINDFVSPKYTLSEQNSLNSSYAIEENNSSVEGSNRRLCHSTNPNSIVYRIHLPQVVSSIRNINKEIDIDVVTSQDSPSSSNNDREKKRLILQSFSDRKHNYHLDLTLPYSSRICENRTKAEWDNEEKVLTVTIPLS